jgi:hypothetical protein
MNGEPREREKVRCGTKKMDSPKFKAFQQYHNYFGYDDALEGWTPAEMANIKIEGRNKWVTVIQNASKKTQTIV